VWVLGWFRLPAVREHLTHSRSDVFAEYLAVAREPNHLRAFVFSFFMVLGTFTIVSFIGPYFASTNGWTESHLAVIYLSAGACTLPGMMLVGRLSDRMSRLLLFRIIAAITVVMTVLITNMPATPLWVACVALSGFMVVATGRVVPAQAMLLGAATPRVRGAFLSLNTFVSHLATGLGPALAGALLVRNPDGTLSGYPVVGAVASLSAVVALVLAGFVRPAKEPMTVIIPGHQQDASAAAEAEPKATAV
jgi:MFS transporter, DHA1 family, inner membrane transport protein